MLRVRPLAATVLALALALGAVRASAQAPGRYVLFPFAPNLSSFIDQYYTAPDADRALQALVAFDFEDFLAKAQSNRQDHARAVLLAFYTHVLRAAPGRDVALARSITGDGSAEKMAFAGQAIAYADTARKDEALKLIAGAFTDPAPIMQRFDSLVPFPYPHMQVRSSTDVDILWACFLGSGVPDYIASIANGLVYWQPLDQIRDRLQLLAAHPRPPNSPEAREFDALLIGQVTFESLRLLAPAHVMVRETLELIAGGRTDRVGEVAGAIVAADAR